MRIAVLSVIMLFACKRPVTMIANYDMEGTIPQGSKVTFVPFEEGELNRNDIVLFDSHLKEYKLTHPTMLRIVGMPGDKVEIIKGEFYVNEKLFPLPKSSRFTYLVKSNQNFAKFTNNKYQNKIWTDSTWIVYLSETEVKEVAKLPQIDSMYLYISDSTEVFESVVAAKNFKRRNHYYWGPYSIPKKGEVIDRDLISVTPNYLEHFDEGSIINQNYYFLAADNQFGTFDSRTTGLVPENVIKGVLKKVE